jgi:hypothetical protein
LKEVNGVPWFALNHQLGLQGADDELGTGGAAADVNVGDGFVLLVFEKVNEARSSRPRGRTKDSSWVWTSVGMPTLMPSASA